MAIVEKAANSRCRSGSAATLRTNFQSREIMIRQAIKTVLGAARVNGRPVLLDAARVLARTGYRIAGVIREPQRLLRSIAVHPLAVASKHRILGPIIFARTKKIIRNRPLDLNIEVSNFCAASCVFCPNSKVKRTKSEMGMDTFMRLAADYYVAGGGALGLSSMQSDVFSDKLLLRRLKHLKDGYAEPERFYIYTTTYLVGAAKYSDEDLEGVLRRIDYLQISLGGTDRDSYRKMYGINAFDTVRTQLLRIKRIVDENRLPIRLSLMFRTQHPELSLGSELVRELAGTFDVAENRNSFFSWGGIIGQSDLPEGARLSVVDNKSKRVDCAVAYASMSIGVDGTVVGCGCVDWNAKHVVGNAVTDKWTKVWKSEKAIAFREAFSRGNVPDLCKDCSLYVPVDEAFSKESMRGYQPSRGLWYLQ